MISTDFYQPTTYYNNNLSGQSPDRNTLVNQNVWDGTDAQPYFLGWCKLPTALDVTRFKTENEGGVTRFTAYGSEMDNVSYTYNVNYSTYFEGIGATYSFLPANVDATQGRNGHLPNKLQVGTLLTQSYCHIWALYRTSDTEEISGSWQAYEVANLGVTIQLSDFNTLLGFLTGETAVQLAFRNPQNQTHTKTFELTGTDFDETGYYHYSGALDSGYGDIYLFIARFEAFTGRDYTVAFPSDPSQNLADSYTHAWGMIKTPWSLLTAYSSLGYWTSYAMYFDFRTNTMPWFQAVPVVGNIEEIYGYGLKFTITSDNPVLVSGNKDVFIDGNVIGVNAGTNYLQIFRMFTPTECLEVMAIQPRYIGGVPHIGEDGAPIIGEFTNDPDEMTPWQLGDITDSEYTDDDRPPYEPEPSGDDEESGDRIPNQFRYFSGATNFITQYALTRTQVGQFGTKLWTSWADSLGDPTDMWKNFKIFIGGGDTGSIDIGTVLSFIVSLRVFPFDLSAYLGQSEPSIKIGTGNYPIEVANVWKLLSTVTYIDCGTVNVPRKFNDFRDYTNVTVSCYFPYCGTVQLNAGDVVGKTLHAWYAVDLQSGECLAVLESYDDTGMLYNVASISGSMGALIPITATNSGQIMAQRISDAANVAGFFVGNVTRGADIFSSGMLGKKKSARRQSAMISGIADAISGQLDDIGDLANQGMSMLARGAIECPSMSGGSGLAAFMTPDSPYIQLRYGIYSEPNNYSHSVGRVSTSSNPIGNYKGSGYIVCENVDTSGLTCHNNEKAAIAAALETGVFV